MKLVLHFVKMYQELEVFADPMRKEVSTVRRRLDLANRELKSLAQICQKKVRFLSSLLFIDHFRKQNQFFYSLHFVQEREYKEVLEAFQEKNKEKAQLTTALVEVKPKLRIPKLERI